MKKSRRLVVAATVAMAVAAAGCGGGGSSPAAGRDGTATSSDSTATDSSSDTSGTSDVPDSTNPELASGPITLVTLGDSLTFGEGDEEGLGYTGRLLDLISAESDRSGSTLVNLGVSGWTSLMVNEGGDGEPSQLSRAVDEVQRVVGDGGAVMATLLIGSNDLWFLYEYGPEEGTGRPEEELAEQTYRANIERTVYELQTAGAFVVLGLPDDQSRRAGVRDLDALHQFLPTFTEEEVEAMSKEAARFRDIVTEIAAARGVPTVKTDDPFWGDSETMAEDLVHPNGDGYGVLAKLFMDVIKSAL